MASAERAASPPERISTRRTSPSSGARASASGEGIRAGQAVPPLVPDARGERAMARSATRSASASAVASSAGATGRGSPGGGESWCSSADTLPAPGDRGAPSASIRLTVRLPAKCCSSSSPPSRPPLCPITAWPATHVRVCRGNGCPRFSSTSRVPTSLPFRCTPTGLGPMTANRPCVLGRRRDGGCRWNYMKIFT